MKASSILLAIAFTAAQAAAVAEPRGKIVGPHNTYNSCGVPGITCAKTKRAALAVAEALAEARGKIVGSHSTWSSCGVPGITCAKARRSLEELGSATERALDNVFALDKDESAMAHRASLHHGGKLQARGHIVSHPSPYSSCGSPGITCAKAKRGAELIAEDFPNIHKDECFAPGGECHAVLAARAAFDDAVKRENELVARGHLVGSHSAWSSCGSPGITCARDVYDYAAAKVKGDPAADQAEEECNGPDGHCTKAESYFKDLDAALTKATNEVLAEA